MHCPHCGVVFDSTAAECPHCGIVIAKYVERQARLRESSATEVWDAVGDSSTVPEAATTPSAAVIGRGLLLLLLVLWTTALAGRVNAERVTSSFLHLPNLVFHEAGHFLFLPFGRFMTVLGGSLTQVLVPLVCAAAFLREPRDRFAAAVAIWWAGENLLDVAPYIDDARALKLVLLGGHTGAEVKGHDWEYLLNAMGMAHRDHAIAAAVQTVGNLTMLAAIVWGAVVLLQSAAAARQARSDVSAGS